MKQDILNKKKEMKGKNQTGVVVEFIGVPDSLIPPVVEESKEEVPQNVKAYSLEDQDASPFEGAAKKDNLMIKKQQSMSTENQNKKKVAKGLDEFEILVSEKDLKRMEAKKQYLDQEEQKGFQV